jgi:putative spermidine/putrescine transport system substrate-binding protein
MRVLGLALIAGMLLTGTATAQQQSDVTIKVANYGGQFTAAQKKYAGELFTKRTGVKVQYIDANPADHLNKMIAARGREAIYDVVYLDLDIQANAIKAGVLEKFDASKVSNVAHLYPQTVSKDGYGPGMMIYSIGIAYNPQKFKDAGIPAPTSWADLWDPRLAGKVIVPDLSAIQGRAFLVAATRLAGGNEGQLEKGIAKIAELKYHSIYTSSAQVEALFPTGDIWAAPFADGRSWGLIDKGVSVAFVRPKEGAVVSIGTLDVAKGSKYPKEAYEYINTVLDPYSQLGQAYELPFGPTNALLAPVLKAYPEVSKKFVASLDDLKQGYIPDWTTYNTNAEKAIDLWNRQVVRK